MMGSVVSKALVMTFGYAYPAYQCFKAVENNTPQIHHLLYWCRYWILIAMLTICERLGDNLIYWVPMYSEAKLGLFIYLWHHKTRGTSYVYDCFLRPFVKKHENEIDNCLSEVRIKGGEIALLFWEKAGSYGHAKFFEILRYASTSTKEQNATNDEPISSSNCDEQQGQCSEQLEEKLLSLDNGASELCEQQTFPKQSVQTRQGRWKLFKK